MKTYPDSRNTRLTLVLPASEREKIVTEALESGQTVSTYLLELIRIARGREKEDES